VKEERKIPSIKWVDECNRKEESRSGVKCFEKFNVSLLCKWKWRIVVFCAISHFVCTSIYVSKMHTLWPMVYES